MYLGLDMIFAGIGRLMQTDADIQDWSKHESVILEAVSVGDSIHLLFQMLAISLRSLFLMPPFFYFPLFQNNGLG